MEKDDDSGAAWRSGTSPSFWWRHRWHPRGELNDDPICEPFVFCSTLTRHSSCAHLPRRPHSHAIHQLCSEYTDAKVCRLRPRRMWDVVVALMKHEEECGSRGADEWQWRQPLDDVRSLLHLPLLKPLHHAATLVAPRAPPHRVGQRQQTPLQPWRCCPHVPATQPPGVVPSSNSSRRRSRSCSSRTPGLLGLATHRNVRSWSRSSRRRRPWAWLCQCYSGMWSNRWSNRWTPNWVATVARCAPVGSGDRDRTGRTMWGNATNERGKSFFIFSHFECKVTLVMPTLLDDDFVMYSAWWVTFLALLCFIEVSLS
jgi:hypothetical protein